MINNIYKFGFISNEKNIVTLKSKQADHFFEIMILEEELLRIRTYEEKPRVNKTFMIAPDMEDIPYEGRNNMDLSPFSCPSYKLDVHEDSIQIETEKILLKVRLDGIQLTWINKSNGEVFLNDRKTQSYSFDNALGEGVYHYVERTLDEAYYGLGEKAGKTNRYGQSYKMMNVDPMGYDAESTDPLYKHVPFYIVKKFGMGTAYGVLYDNLATSTFDMGRELDNYHGFYRYFKAEAGDLDYYVMLGESILDVTKKVSRLTGKTIMPPKWTLGYSGSTMYYTDSPDAENLLSTFIDDCRKYDIPCSSFQLSSGYTSIGTKRYVFNWNYDKFPEPERVSKKFNESGMELCANIKPALLKDHPMYEELQEKGYFVKDRNADKNELVQFWDDTGSYVDFTNPEAFNWWKEMVTEKLLKYGIMSTWNDNNEFEIWDEDAKVNWFGEERSVRDMKPVLTLLMLKASFEAQKAFTPDKRPYLISRSGTLGMQKYVQTWSGDNRTDFKTIRYNTKMGVGLSLSGIYNIGHDVGGFAGDKPNAELFVRWIENGIFHPRFTIHSWNDDGTVNEPWMHPEVMPHVRRLIKFRYKLIPYLYNLLYKAHKEYEPIIRSTFMNYEEDLKTFEENDDYMLGDSLLIANMMDEGEITRKVYLPKESEGWYDMNSGFHYSGGQVINLSAGLGEIPVLVRAGSMIPLNTSDITFDTKDVDERTYMLYPLKGDGVSKEWFYEDDGITMDYDKGIYRKTTIIMECSEDFIKIAMNFEGSYKPSYTSMDIQLPEQETRNILINGNSVAKNVNNIYSVQI